MSFDFTHFSAENIRKSGSSPKLFPETLGFGETIWTLSFWQDHPPIGIPQRRKETKAMARGQDPKMVG